MKLMRYEVKETQSHAQRAARWATLTPICGTSWRHKSFQVSMDRVRELWHRRVDSLSDVQLPVIASTDHKGRTTATYWKNCPPIGAVGAHLRICKRALICPFCYGRNILSAMASLETALYGHGPKRKALADRDDIMLVDYTVSIRFSATNMSWQATEAGREPVWETFLGTWAAGKKREVDRLNHLGGCVMQRLQFDNDSWTLLRSGVFLCTRQAYELRKLEPAACEDLRKDVTPASRENLARAVGRAFRYPDNVLVTAPEIVREYVERMDGVRTLERYGILRNRAT